MFTKERSTAMKGIAIAAMLFHHCFFTSKIYSGYVVNFFPLSEYLVNNIAVFGKFCVGTFAFVSGYGLTLKWEQSAAKGDNLSRFFLSRYIQTMSGFWFIYPLCLLFCHLMDGRTAAVYIGSNTISTAWQYLLSFLGVARLMGTPNLIYEWWYLSAAVIFILLVPLFCQMTKKLGGTASLLLVVLIPRLLGMEIAGGTHPFSFLMPTALGVVACRTDFFVRIRQLFSPFACQTCGRAVLFAFALLGMVVAYFLYRKLPFEQYWELKYGLVPLIVILCCSETVLTSPLTLRIFGYLGRHSMNMYLLHMLFLTYFKVFLFHGRHFLVSFALLLAGSLALSILVEWLKKCLRWQALTQWLLSRILG